MAAASIDFDTEILEAAVAPESATLSPPIARAVLGIKFTDRQQTEVQRLLNRSNSGTITPRQKKRLESYVRVGNFLNLLKIKAQSSLDQRERRK